MIVSGEIKYYISETPISNIDEIEDNSWTTYEDGITENFTLGTGNLEEMYDLYLALKDESGNTNLIYSGSNIEYTIKYNENALDAKLFTSNVNTKAYYGTPFLVTSKMPTREDYYFLGWSTNPDANAPSFKRGEIIPASVFVGGSQTINLYAVWAQNEDENASISNLVDVGDYIDLPITYDNVNGSQYTGWRVISKDVNLDGNESIGTVNLVSAGTPLTYYHGDNAATSVAALMDDFLTTSISSTENYAYRKNGFSEYKTLEEIFNSPYIAKKADGTPVVRAMNAEDIYQVTKLQDMQIGSTMELANSKYENLLVNEANYWVVTMLNQTDLWSVAENGNVEGHSNQEYGIRTVVTLNPGVKITGNGILGEWKVALNSIMTSDLNGEMSTEVNVEN